VTLADRDIAPGPRPNQQALADALADLGYADGPEVLRCLLAAGRAEGPQVLVAGGLVTADQLAHALAVVAGLEFVDLDRAKLDLGAANRISRETARHHQALPIGYDEDGSLLVAVSDPANRIAASDIALSTGEAVRVVVASAVGLGRAIDRLEHLGDEPEAAPAEEEAQPDAAVDEAPVVRLVQAIIGDALDQRASDIHFEAEDGELRVKLRIDGVLVRTTIVPRALAAGVVSRIKILSDLDISERRAPQDGRMRFAAGGRRADLRVVTIPVVDGESVVLRVLDTGARPATFAELGLTGRSADLLEDALADTYGAILVTGPTGSGKTTTLYAALQRLNGGERSIITVEDPVEYRISNAKQVQLNPNAGMTFANALRTLVRADPDIIMVGEVRDHETAKIAVESALTGHLVLTTLHTNDAASALVRLVEMGIEPFLVASAVRCVVAQRLVRRLCGTCRVPVRLAPDVLAAGGFATDGPVDAYDAAGCPACAQTGYRGRLGVYEVLRVGGAVRALALAGADAVALTAQAAADGMIDLRTDALVKLRDGETSLAEITRVLGRAG
jgi:type IV pilus assembly protein PilB